MQLQELELESTSLEILPKRNELNPLNAMGLDPDSFKTNCYEIEVTQKSLFLYQYHIVTDPVIPSDSMKIWYKLVKNIELKLQKWIGLISHRSNVLWGNKYLQGQSLDLIWVSKYKTRQNDDTDLMDTQSFASSAVSFSGTSVAQSQSFSLNPINKSMVSNTSSVLKERPSDSKPRYKEAETKYRVSIKLTNKLDLRTLLTDEKEKSKIIQIINIKIKDKLESLGYLQLGKGRFYEKSKFQQDYIEEVGLQVLRGFRFSLMALPNNRLCLQIDTCTRILQSANLLEIIRNMGKQAPKKLKGAIVISKYGNYKTYKIDDIDYRKNPGSFFYTHEARKGKKPGENALKIKKTFAQYFKQAYGITVNDMKQPLVKILNNPVKFIKRETIREKPSYAYLIPELLSMTGMTLRQRNDKNAMKAIAPYTKLTPKARFIESQKIIHQIQSADRINQKDNKEDFSMIKIKEPTVVKGFQLNPVYVTLKDTEKVEDGEFNIKQPLLSPAKFTDWILYCSNGTNPEKIKQFTQLLKTASKELEITLKDPYMNVVKYSAQEKTFFDRQALWIAGLDKELQKGKTPQIVVLYLQSFEENFYSEIKRQVINKHGVPSQVVKAATFERQNGSLSIATGIIVQMNQKIGKTVWKVERNHPQFQEKNFQVFSTTKKQKDESANQNMILDSSCIKSKSSRRSQKQRRHKGDKKEKKEKKSKKEKSEIEIKPQEIQGLPSSETSQISSFQKSAGHKVLEINDLSQSLSIPSSFLTSGANSSSNKSQSYDIQVSDQSMKGPYSSKIDESSSGSEKKHSKEDSYQSSIIQVDESSQNTEKTEKKDKKEKKQKKEKKEKKQKKDKKDKNDQEKSEMKEDKKTKEKQEQLKQNVQTDSQIVSNFQGDIKSKQQLRESQASKSKKSEKYKKQKKDKKQKHEKKQKKETKEKHQVEKPKIFENTYEDFLIMKEERKMASAKKKIVDEKVKLQLTSDLEIACAGFSSSTSSANGKFTMSFVGTTNKEQSQVYTHCRYGLRQKNYLPDLEFEVIFNYWLRTYYEKSVSIIDGVQRHLMPSVLIIYREGMSEDQLKKQIYREVRILKKVIAEKVPKVMKYDPEIIYVTVNKRASVRFFDNKTKDACNASEGSVVFDQFARNNTMDFHLISQHVQNTDGTAVPTQYRIVYRNRFTLSEAALAQFTYQQCHNYYNWAGSVRIPAVLQCAGKLSKLVGESVRQNVFKVEKKKKTEKKEEAFKFIEQSLVSQIGQQTAKIINNTSMTNSFSLFSNTNQLSLSTNSFAQSNISAESLSSMNTSLASSMVKFSLESNIQEAKKSKPKPSLNKDKEREKRPKPIDRPDRTREIIDSFFFL